MKKINSQLILEKLLELSEICNEILINNFQNLNKNEIFYKDNQKEICTKIDLEINQISKEFLEKNFPGAKFISEEDENSKAKISDQDLYFVIDPIDGTSNFVNGLEFFCISIGVIFNYEFIGGIVSIPILNKVFYGIKDIGSFLKNLRTEKIIKLEYNENFIENNKNKNEKKDLIGCSTIFAKKLKKKISSRIIGSIGISIAYCSDSTFDGFFCPSCKIWDFAGGIGILNSMNFPIFLKEINQEKKIFQVAVHRDQEELQKFIELFNEE